MADEQILLATGAPAPVNTSLLAPVASSGAFSDLQGRPTALTDFTNDLVSTSGPFAVLGDLKLTTGTVASDRPISLNGGLQVTPTAVAVSNSLQVGGPISVSGAATCNATMAVSGSITCGSGIKAQGVQLPRTSFGTTAGMVTVPASAAGAGTLTINYGVVYATTPAVAMTVNGAALPLLATAQAVTKTGCTAALYNLSGADFTGTVSVAWHAMSST